MTKKKTVQIFIGIIALQLLVIMYYGLHKEGYLYDEIITYERAAEVFVDRSTRPNFEYQKNFYNKIYTGADFSYMVTVQPGDSFFEQPIKSQIGALTSSRTYNLFLNIIMSVGDGQFHDWYSIGFNMLLFVFLQICLFKIAQRLGCNDKFSLFVVAFYGFSVAAVKPVIYLRFYEMYLLFALLCLLAASYLLQAPKIDWKWGLCAFSTLIFVWYGYLNAEYMVVYAAAFVFAFVVMALRDKQRIKALVLCGLYLICGIAYLFSRWHGLKKVYAAGGLFADSVDKFFTGNWGETVQIFMHFIQDIVQDGGLVVLGVACIIAFIVSRERKGITNGTKLGSTWWMTLILAVSFLVIVSRVAPYEAWRYSSVLQPLAVLLVVSLLQKLVISEYYLKILLTGVMCVQCIWLFFLGSQMGCLKGEARKDMKVAAEETIGDTNCVMFSSGDTGDLYYGAYIWPENAEIYVTTVELYAEETEEKAQILQDDTIYAWVRNEETWNNEVSRLLQEDGYTSAQLVLDTGSTRWLIYKCER